MTAVEASSFPSVFKEGWLRLNKRIPFLSGADGVVSKRSRSLLINIRVAHLIFLLEFTNHPVCAAEERDLLIEAQPPLLEKEGNELASTAVTDFEIACLRHSPEIRCLCAPHPLVSQPVGQFCIRFSIFPRAHRGRLSRKKPAILP